MPTLLDTVKHLQTQKEAVLRFEKTKDELSIDAASAKSSELFRLVHIDLTRVSSVCAGKDEGEIVLDLNVNKVHKTSSGFVPKIICVGGVTAFKKAKASGKVFANIWVGDKVLHKFNIQADGISSNDLGEKVRTAVQDAYTKRSTGSYDDATTAYVIDIYPFDSYCVFRRGKDMYKQEFKIDKASQEVTLEGKPVKVIEKYVVAPANGMTASSAAVMGSLLDRPNNGPVLGALVGPATSEVTPCTIVNYGAPGSEANNPAYKLMLNVEEALDMYVTETATGVHKVVYPPFATLPPGLAVQANEAKIAARSAGIDMSLFSCRDFISWQDKRMRASIMDKFKLDDGEKLTSNCFASVGEIGDPSTWFARMDSVEAATASLRNIKDVPRSVRAEAKEALQSVIAGTEPKRKRDAGPHLGYGKPANKYIKEIQTKLKAAIGDTPTGKPMAAPKFPKAPKVPGSSFGQNGPTKVKQATPHRT